MSEEVKAKRSEYAECSVVIYPYEEVLKECEENGYPSVDIMMIIPERKPELGKTEKSSIKAESLAEINTEKQEVRFVNGEEKAAFGIKKAPTTDDLKKAKAEAERRKAEAERKALEEKGRE
ncbi:MAG: hypothetical protein IKG42_06530 [Clostridia bacterium]|nr:hypothetical protein [Clostridia bacterium]